ncbi:unnamed protein product [Allacma fusca]|uniref:Uncharacterized protein n=1 Tax=Allacma fusca TaxID=39272 RepID=A0A8J2KVQ2_9HEXA|nr:unnamed protein product [Allacma fusca]
MLLAKHPDGTFVDPEYHKFYSKWFGFLFWEWDLKFNLNQNFTLIKKSNNRPTLEPELKEILKKLMWKPFEPRKSPWEFLALQNYQSDSDAHTSFPKSVLIYRIHHDLSDGTKIIRLLLQDMNNISVELNAKPSFVRKDVSKCTGPDQVPYFSSVSTIPNDLPNEGRQRLAPPERYRFY